MDESHIDTLTALMISVVDNGSATIYLGSKESAALIALLKALKAVKVETRPNPFYDTRTR